MKQEHAALALYARQSIDKKDSISVESQLELCVYEARGRPYETFTDKGYSGKNTNRPAFLRMMQQIRQGKIHSVVVYKLDRISRSILDFSNLMETFQEYGVEFISATEKFDTSTPIGRAMLHICIVFAQLERETIQKRVADAYYSRCQKGLYMGGRVPYGYRREPAELEGVQTCRFVTVPDESEQVRRMYALYAGGTFSLGDIVRDFEAHGLKHLRGGNWNTARISEILRNPVYVQADEETYRFFVDQGARVINSMGDFTGENGCYAFRDPQAKEPGGRGSLLGKEIVLAPHRGIVPADEWLRCRRRCLHNRRSTRTCKPKNSWLCGKIKCGSCGGGLSVAKAKTHWNRYFVCRPKPDDQGKQCPGTGGVVYAEVLEQYVWKAVCKRAAALFRNPALAQAPLLEGDFQQASFEEKQAAADLFLSEIRIGGGVIEIVWNL